MDWVRSSIKGEEQNTGERRIGKCKMYHARQMAAARGFTLIELMLVIGIIAILVTIAVPAYQDYTVRTKITECVNGASVGKVGISEYRQSLGAWPPTLEQAGLEVSGISQYCTALINYQAGTGAFTIDVDEAAIDPVLAANSIRPVMTPTENASNIIDWECSRGTTSVDNLKYLPPSCRDADA